MLHSALTNGASCPRDNVSYIRFIFRNSCAFFLSASLSIHTQQTSLPPLHLQALCLSLAFVSLRITLHRMNASWEMQNFSYYNASGDNCQPLDFPTSQGLSFSLDPNTQAIQNEFMLQEYIASQLLSPPLHQHQRQDSMFSHSSSNDTKSGGPSPYQAEVQPCMQASQSTPHSLALGPVSMARNSSQISNSSGQRLRHDPQRASISYSSTTIVPLSRSITQQSNGSPGYQYQQRVAAHRPQATDAPQEYTVYSSLGLGQIAPAMSASDVAYYPTTSFDHSINSMYNSTIDHLQTPRLAPELGEIGAGSESSSSGPDVKFIE